MSEKLIFKKQFEDEVCSKCDYYSLDFKCCAGICKKDFKGKIYCYIDYLEKDNVELRKHFNYWPHDKRKALEVLSGRLQKEINILKEQNYDCVKLLRKYSDNKIINMNDVYKEVNSE